MHCNFVPKPVVCTAKKRTYYQEGVKLGKSIAGAIVGTVTGVIGGVVGILFGAFMNDEEID